jgi:polysaccharide export outer membrane protein
MTRIKFLIISAVLLLTAMVLLLTGCAGHRSIPPGTVKEIAGSSLQTASPIVEQETVIIPPLNDPPPPADYVVGPNDSILVSVSGHPEFSREATGGGSATQNSSRVDGSGNVQIPILGLVPVGGLTLPQIRDRIQELLLKYLREPSVVVEMVEFKSHPFYVLGQFRNAGVFYMDRPFNVLQGIAMGQGYNESANLRTARIIRDKKVLPVDIYELLMNADQAQNVWLKSGDTIYMPENKTRVVLVFGAGKSGVSVPIPPKGLNLLEAIATAGLQEIGFHSKRVFLIRSFSPTRGQLMVIDIDKILHGDALPVALAEGDILYIPKSSLTTWNEALGEMLPTLSAFGAIISPFVQVKYLTQ